MLSSLFCCQEELEVEKKSLSLHDRTCRNDKGRGIKAFNEKEIV